ncbi:CsbD family protein [Phreatobacter sp.]|uniref:CsbD family protein n=1 Tax=Phreatobacter sp. TaxID=1966341 RepID=UPI0022BB473E|nr:CsbD family protein [Phreatobacter sp.]MCZ8314119.1 CsbD family protein [Phreatobacter sp.]
MSSTTDEIKGMANQAMGNVKQGLGKVLDNTEMQAEGKLQELQELKGEGQQLKGDAKDAVKTVVDRA